MHSHLNAGLKSIAPVMAAFAIAAGARGSTVSPAPNAALVPRTLAAAKVTEKKDPETLNTSQKMLLGAGGILVFSIITVFGFANRVGIRESIESTAEEFGL